MKTGLWPAAGSLGKPLRSVFPSARILFIGGYPTPFVFCENQGTLVSLLSDHSAIAR